MCSETAAKRKILLCGLALPFTQAYQCDDREYIALRLDEIDEIKRKEYADLLTCTSAGPPDSDVCAISLCHS